MSTFNELSQAFIPLFIAMDALGMVPVYLSLTQGMSATSRKKLITEAVLVCLVICVIFMAGGKFLFRFLGITENDFRIGGGIVLLILAIMDLLFSQQQRRKSDVSSVGIVPIGIPLIVGPAALTTILISVDAHGYLLTTASILLNLLFVWILYMNAHWTVKVMGDAGSKAFAKIASLFLAAIAVMMIRVGLTNFIKDF